jgi:hypothetical protein
MAFRPVLIQFVSLWAWNYHVVITALLSENLIARTRRTAVYENTRGTAALWRLSTLFDSFSACKAGCFVSSVFDLTGSDPSIIYSFITVVASPVADNGHLAVLWVPNRLELDCALYRAV